MMRVPGELVPILEALVALQTGTVTVHAEFELIVGPIWPRPRIVARLVHLVARLKAGHYRLLDTQFVTEHLRTFGAVEVTRPVYHKLLDAALVGEGDFGALALDRPVPGEAVLARLAAG